MASKTSGIGIGSLIKQYREEHRITQRELAAAAGLSIGTLRDLEQERTRFPRWVTIEGLTAVLGLSQAERAELTRFRRAGEYARRPPMAHGTATRVLVEILGPVAAWRDGSRVPLGSARQRAVLGMLALHAGTGLHREAIIDLLWEDEPPASAVAQVQRYVSQLRRLLGDAPAEHAGTETGTAGVVTTVGGCCYRLNADTKWLRVDLAVFRRMTGEARDSARTDPAAACGKYEHALGLWRGDLMADVDLMRDHPAAVEVRRLHADAVLGFAEAAVIAGAHARTHPAARAGMYDRVLPWLRWLCAAEPLNEQAHASLMITLAAAGQQAVALQVFAEVRHRLDSELGISPGAVLAHAYTQVLRGQVGRSEMSRYLALQRDGQRRA
jgi:DNA-binding SARP family transcriptional activator/DNA-binding XRE family transcriptional regulator